MTQQWATTISAPIYVWDTQSPYKIAPAAVTMQSLFKWVSGIIWIVQLIDIYLNNKRDVIA